MPNLPLIVIPHPLGGLKPGVVKERTDCVTEAIINYLSL